MISEIITVLQKGRELQNAETWKNRQMALGALSGLLGAAFALAHAFGLAPELDADTVNALAGGVVAVVGVFNAWATAATSKRAGVSPRGAPDGGASITGGD